MLKSTQIWFESDISCREQFLYPVPMPKNPVLSADALPDALMLLRLSSGLGRSQVVAAGGASTESQLSLWESGKQTPRLEKILGLIKIFGRDLVDLQRALLAVPDLVSGSGSRKEAELALRELARNWDQSFSEDEPAQYFESGTSEVDVVEEILRLIAEMGLDQGVEYLDNLITAATAARNAILMRPRPVRRPEEQ